MKNTINNKKKPVVIDIESLKNKLRHGHYTKIAAKVHKSPQCISKQFTGETSKIKQAYIMAALEVLKEEEKEAIETNKLIKQL